MVKKIIFLALVVLLISCNIVNKQSNVYLDLNNKQLEQQIINYSKYSDSLNKDRTYILRVYCSEVNDSTNRFVIESNIDIELIKMMPYHFICKVDGHEVFFTMLSGIVKKDWGKRNFFNLKQSSYLDLMKQYFPEEYKNYIKNEKTFPRVIYEPDLCYLTFINDKLVKKEMKRGLPWW